MSAVIALVPLFLHLFTIDLGAASAIAPHPFLYQHLFYVSVGAGIAVCGAVLASEQLTTVSPLLTPEEAAA